MDSSENVVINEVSSEQETEVDDEVIDGDDSQKRSIWSWTNHNEKKGMTKA
jgi:hypothetical protein